MANTPVDGAIFRIVTPADDVDLRIRYQVLIFREIPVNKWMGSYNVLDLKLMPIYADVKCKLS